VHPTKAWVRFRSPRVVQEALFTALQRALRSSRVVQPQGGLAVTGHGEAALGPDVAPWSHPAVAALAAPIAGGEAASAQPGLFQEAPHRYGRPRFGAVIGQLQDTFIVSANEDEVFFVDQHVAHERVLFEQLLGLTKATPLASQELLFPQTLELGPGHAALMRECAPVLDGLGFAIEEFGGRGI